MTTDRLLTQNSEMRKSGVWNWTIPAHWTRVNGKIFHTCPQAGVCAQICYAKYGTYRFPTVKAKHQRNLERVLSDPDRWMQDMLVELRHKRFSPTMQERDLPVQTDPWLEEWRRVGGQAVRIHDSGDFFSEDYLHRWMSIAEAVPWVLFYAYTKEVSLFLRQTANMPANLHVLFSTGGLEDHLIPDDARHADVFPTVEEMEAAGYTDQSANDLLAVFLPTNRVGIPANRIAAANKIMAGRRLSIMVQPNA